MVEDTRSGLDLTEAVPLGCALVARVAQDVGVRALAIKGPVLEAQGLRAPRTTVDVDVLVEPAGLAALEAALTERGWRNVKSYDHACVLPMHAINLEHAAWPCEVDLHHWFPGFLRDSSDVFDLLWDRHVCLDLAGAPVRVVDPVAHAALVGLNHLRHPHDRASRDQLSALAALVARWAPETVRDLVVVAEETGAALTLAPFLRQVGAPPATQRHPTVVASDLWRLSAEVGARPVVPWLVELARTPWRRRPAVVLRALRLADRQAGPMASAPATPSARRAVLARWRRVRRAAPLFPGSLRDLRALGRAGLLEDRRRRGASTRRGGPRMSRARSGSQGTSR